MDALIEDAGAGWLEFVDVCKGAIKMQMLKGGVWRFTAACGVVGLIVAGVIAFSARAQYQSTAVLRMAAGQWDDQVEKLNQAEQEILSRKSLYTVIHKYDLYGEERKTQPLEDVISGMRNRYIQLRVLQIPKTTANAFSIRYQSGDPAKAQAVTTYLTERFITALKDSAPLELLDPASPPKQADGSNRPVMLAVGLVLGMAAGMVLLGIRRWPLIPLTGLAVAIVVWPASYLLSDTYRSQAVLRSKTADVSQAAREVVNNRAFLASVMQEYALYSKRPNGVDLMQRSLVVQSLNATKGKVCIVRFDYSDRYKAQRAVQEIVSKIAESWTVKVEVLDPPQVAEQALTPNRLAIVVVALFAGLVAGAIALAVRRHRAPGGTDDRFLSSVSF
ncbi:membrane hypothetical protein [Candidatus Sulfopaludibacter sp. SbA3]|nr:membrane hypothetical protein [Candidatus Sulfopaludibacter sp. SbA3]